MQRRRSYEERDELDERIVDIARVSKVIKGGRRFGFRVVVVVGDNQGQVGVGMGKARSVPDAIRKAAAQARREMTRIALPGTTIPEAVKLFKALGLEVPSAHVPLPIGKDKNKVLDYMAALGSRCIVSGKGPDSFATLDLIKQTCDLFNEAQAIATDNEMTVGYHNHWREDQQEAEEQQGQPDTTQDPGQGRVAFLGSLEHGPGIHRAHLQQLDLAARARVIGRQGVARLAGDHADLGRSHHLEPYTQVSDDGPRRPDGVRREPGLREGRHEHSYRHGGVRGNRRNRRCSDGADA